MAIILAPVGGLLTAIAVASLGFMGSAALERQQSEEAKLRLYSELMTRREESEATLRKEMFQSIIGSFFDASTSSLDTRLLKMELLAQNFHEALSLSPLFLHLKREIEKANVSPAERRSYEVRLSELAREVTRKQLVVLESGGKRFDWTVLLSDSLLAGLGSEQLEDVTLELDGISRRFRVTLQSVDTAQRQIHMMLETETGSERYAVDFDLGFFSSPMLDNTRLSNDQRVAVVLTDLNSAGASVSPGVLPRLPREPSGKAVLRGDSAKTCNPMTLTIDS